MSKKKFSIFFLSQVVSSDEISREGVVWKIKIIVVVENADMNSGRGPKKERGRKMRLFLFFFQRGDFKNWSPLLGNFHF